MRRLVVIFLVGLGAFACVKPKTSDPIPALEFKSVRFTQNDTFYLTVGYKDGDGDLFRNVTSDGPNFIYVGFKRDETTGKMVHDSAVGAVSAYHSQTVVQPDNGYYKGKSIEGDIIIPMIEPRSSNKIKIVQYQCFMVDMKSHKSNVVASPIYTLDF